MQAIDVLGSEYGWGKKQILEETYFDEYIDLTLEIKKRRMAHYKIILAIVSNPHTEDPQKLIDIFEEQNDYIPSYALDPNAQLDKAGFERLKFAMADNPRINIQS